MISVILCVKNGMEYLPELFASLKRQKNVSNFELIVSDTGSTDGSWEYIKRIKESRLRSAMQNFGGQVNNLRIKEFKIKSQNFGHGKTRNFLLKKTKSEIIVFISQDIKPVGQYWLANLIKPLAKIDIAASFGRQISHTNARIYDQFFYQQAYEKKSKVIRLKDLKMGPATVFYSMVYASARRELLLKHPFSVDKDASVDQWWAKSVLEDGWEIAYSANAVVYHSHNYSYSELFRRNYLSGQSLIGFPKKSFFSAVFSLTEYLIKEAYFIRKFGEFNDFLGMGIYEAVRITGFLAGSWLGVRSGVKQAIAKP